MHNIKEYISEYLFIARDLVEKYNPNNFVTCQFFQRSDNVIFAGINEVLELLKKYLSDKKLKILYLPEGSKINGGEVVLQIEGRYQDFGIYEGIIDGILSRATSIATNSYECVAAANGKELICMADRSDHYCNQARDGAAMLIGGIRSFSSSAQISLSPFKHKIYGSIPHALIQNFEGNLLKCMICYESLFKGKEELIALVDFHNDVISDSLKVLNHFKDRLKGVRVDTSKAIKDKMFGDNEDEYGVTPNQIKKLREALDKNGGKHVKICVSSGFTPERIRYFESENTPVDFYGVGEYLLKVKHFFSANVVQINGKNLAKIGQEYKKNNNLIEFRWK